MDFKPFGKTPRLFRDCVITEKLDGTNAQIFIEVAAAMNIEAIHAFTLDGVTMGMYAGSRERWITPGDDNYGFAAWVYANRVELERLGQGQHFGEWWGRGVGRRSYGLTEKRFSLFNTSRWSDPEVRPACCHVVPELYRGPFSSGVVSRWVEYLKIAGSEAAPGYMKPEGVIVWHEAARVGFKVTCENDEKPKGAVA